MAQFARGAVAVSRSRAGGVRGATAEPLQAARPDLEVPAEEGGRRPRAGRQHASAQAGFRGADRRLVPRRAAGVSGRSHPQPTASTRAGCSSQPRSQRLFDDHQRGARRPRASPLGAADARAVVPRIPRHAHRRTRPGGTARDILCISSIDWDFIWQGHQEIMSRWPPSGHRVLFIENTGVRAPRVRDLPRVRAAACATGGAAPRASARSGRTCSSTRRWCCRCRTRARALDQPLAADAQPHALDARHRLHRPIVWTFLPTPLARELIIGASIRALTIYYCIDDLASSSPEARADRAERRALFQRADLVFVTSEKLRAAGGAGSASACTCFRSASASSVRAVRDEAARLPADIAALPRPVVGYVGGLHQWVDQDCSPRSPARMPDVTFALVGPAQVDVSRLERAAERPPARPAAARRAARLRQGFDVGIVPYRLSEYTANVYPTKLNEYLSMGIPVVATDLAEIRRFNAEHGDVVRVAGDADAFATAIRDALAESPRAGRGAPDRRWRNRTAGSAASQRCGADRRGRRRAKRRARPAGKTPARALRAARRRTGEIVGAACRRATCCCSRRRWSGGSPRRCSSVAAAAGRRRDRRVRRRRRRVGQGRRRRTRSGSSRRSSSIAPATRPRSSSRPATCSRFAKPRS